jgi:hypothetical protein
MRPLSVLAATTAALLIATAPAGFQAAVADPVHGSQQDRVPAPSSAYAELANSGVDAATASDLTDPARSAEPNALEAFSQDEVVQAASNFFGVTSSRVAGAVERIFEDEGQPVGYIQGSEFAGALGAGVRYGRGTLIMRDGTQREVFWQGPSVGFDTGGNASRVFTLVYDLDNPDGIFRRYPGLEGAAFLVAGISVTYQRAEGVTLAPMRTGVGLRAGANIGYTAYSSQRRWLPF